MVFHLAQLWSAVWLQFRFARKNQRRLKFLEVSCCFMCKIIVSVAVGVLKKGAKYLVHFVKGASPPSHPACSHLRQQLPSDPVTVVPPAAKIPPDDYRFFPPEIFHGKN